MIEPRNRLADRRRALRRRSVRPPQQQHRYAEAACGGDLAVGGRATAVLGDNDVDGVREQQGAIIVLAERAASPEVSRVGHGERRVDGFDAANEISVLRSPGKRRNFLPAKREKHVLRLGPEVRYRILGALNLDPSVAGYRAPWRAPQGKHRRVGQRGGGDRVCGDLLRIRMRRIDQYTDLVLPQMARQPVDPSESAAAHRHGLGQGSRRAARERQGRGDVMASRETFSELPGLRRPSENQDMSTHVTY